MDSLDPKFDGPFKVIQRRNAIIQVKPKRKNKWVHLNRCKPYLGYETVDELSTFQGRPCYEEETEIRLQNKDEGKTSSQSPIVEDSHDREPKRK